MPGMIRMKRAPFTRSRFDADYIDMIPVSRYGGVSQINSYIGEVEDRRSLKPKYIRNN